MLQSMREGAKSPIMKAFLLFLAAGFALWGIGDISSGLFSDGNKAIKAVINLQRRLKSRLNLSASDAPQVRYLTGDAVQFGLLVR